jgi:hypothetical protein
MWFIRVLSAAMCLAAPSTAMPDMYSDPSWPKLPSLELQRLERERATRDEIALDILMRSAAAQNASAQKATEEEAKALEVERARQVELERKRQTVFRNSPDWDYMFYREVLEDGMTDEERDFMRRRAFDAESAKRAWHDVYQYRRVNRTYADAGPRKALAAFTIVALSDVVLLVVACVMGIASLRWWMALPLGGLAGVGMWIILKNTAPWSTWAQLALLAHAIAAALVATGAFALKRATLKLIMPSRVSSERKPRVAEDIRVSGEFGE